MCEHNHNKVSKQSFRLEQFFKHTQIQQRKKEKKQNRRKSTKQVNYSCVWMVEL